MGTSGTLDPRCTRLDLPENMHADMVNLADGSILTVIDNTVLISEDGGKSWLERGPVCTSPPPGLPRSGMLLRTQNDWVVMVYVDTDAFIWNWNDETRSADANARLDVWAIRSPDGGRTWLDRQRIYEGYCGALINMVELARGGIVAPIQILLRDPDRHAMTSYRSEDDGLTWSHANIIDVGGNGHHDGAMEATTAELTNGSLLMLIRTKLRLHLGVVLHGPGPLLARPAKDGPRRQQRAGAVASPGQRQAVPGLEPAPGLRRLPSREEVRPVLGGGGELVQGRVVHRLLG